MDNGVNINPDLRRMFGNKLTNLPGVDRELELEDSEAMAAMQPEQRNRPFIGL